MQYRGLLVNGFGHRVSSCAAMYRLKLASVSRMNTVTARHCVVSTVIVGGRWRAALAAVWWCVPCVGYRWKDCLRFC
jgi:hypothetical protein